MTSYYTRPTWELNSKFIKELSNHKNLLLIGCISFEDRCTSAIFNFLNNGLILPSLFIQINDDECKTLDWEEKCKSRTEENKQILEDLMDIFGAELDYETYNMSNKKNDLSKFLEKINSYFKVQHDSTEKYSLIVDMSTLPRYFLFPLLKFILNKKEHISDLIVLYTKPLNYTKDPLKRCPKFKSEPDSIPLFKLYPKSSEGVKWITGIGFDYVSIENTLEILNTFPQISKIYPIFPFPGYEPEHLIRNITANKNLFDLHEEKIQYVNNDFIYSAADDPFRSMEILEELIGDDKDSFVLSPFGPKPMSLGFCLASIKKDLAIVHVQATDYNPDYSSGAKNTMAYWIMYDGKVYGFE